MPLPAALSGRSLEAAGDGSPRGMIAHDRTRLIGRLLFLFLVQLMCRSCGLRHHSGADIGLASIKRAAEIGN